MPVEGGAEKRLTTAKGNYDKLQARLIPSVYYVNQPTPLYVTRFTIVPGISTAGSTAIFNALKAAGYIDANNFFTLDPRVSQAWYSSVPAPYNTGAYIPDIEDQLFVAFTQHKFYKDSNSRTIEFFNARRTTGFVELIRAMTDPFYAPFKGIVGTDTVDGARVVWPLAVAILGYMLLHAALRGLLRLIARG